MSYDLAAMARASGVRRDTVDIRSIDITKALEGELFAIMMRPVDLWRAQVKERIFPAYEAARPEITLDAPADDVSGSFTVAEAVVVTGMAGLSQEIADWLRKVVQWHNRQWSNRVKAALGVDVWPFVSASSNTDIIDAMLQRNVSLITSISDDLRKDIAEVIWREFQLKTPPRQVAKMLNQRFGIARRRALLIAADQSGKVAAELSMLRQNEAGIKRYKWVATMDMRTRPAHAALNGKIMRWDKPHPTERYPGYQIRCRCSAASVLDLT